MQDNKRTVVFGFYGMTLDQGMGRRRWERWRPTVALCMHGDMLVDRLELFYQPAATRNARLLVEDIAQVSPETEVRLHEVTISDPWDFEEVFGTMHDLARGYDFDLEGEDYRVHITTGTHVMQICWFLLTESRHIPAALLQTSPPNRKSPDQAGSYTVIDLDLSRYDALARRFAAEQAESLAFLKSGIDTRDPGFNRLISSIERVALRSREPILLMGPTGAGKSRLARRIYALKKHRRQIEGELVEVNCATLRGDQASSALFGHVRGAFTGAASARQGLLRRADGGMLFLDEIGELGLDEQAMLLRAIEQKTFMPVGADREVSSAFQLIAGTNRSLPDAVKAGRFREDLLARIDLWTFRLPGLAQRTADIEPNLEFELGRTGERLGTRISINREARRRFLSFATSPAATWPGNFRDFGAAVMRMATLAPAGRIDEATVEEELDRLRAAWGIDQPPALDDDLEALLGPDGVGELDLFDRVQLAAVVEICRTARSMSAAGRTLFAVSRTKRKSVNDADRLRKYLARFGLSFDGL